MIVGKEAFDVLRLHISPDVLRTCRKLRIIQITGVFPEFLASDRANSTAGQALLKWLHTRLSDQTAEILKCTIPDMRSTVSVDLMLTKFINDRSTASYVIGLDYVLLANAVGFRPTHGGGSGASGSGRQGSSWMI
uniref:Uncharacterized protein n=1 Tax=Globodera rostochiensis TaxID=31243 RepID=A0A914I1T4_GLORO